ncbi:hypothetical protein MJT46_005516 [Ovis ammon polii x Ovis aries]|nr:hypothetical protein MJT46_005516 [Ovis ammon polii x Ovis aries]
MTKTALLKLLLAIVIMFILILPEYFKAPKGNMLELSCLELYLQQNFSYSFFSTNASFVTFLQPIRETQTITGIFLNHSNFQNFTRICEDITSKLKTCFSCLACESKGNTDFIFQEQTSKGHKYKPTSVLLRGSDSEKLRTLNVRVVSAETTERLPMTLVKDVLPPIPELEVTPAVHQQDQHTRSYTNEMQDIGKYIAKK